MTDICTQITEIAQRLEPLCRHVSVRDDERGLFILAIGNDGVHSLELWHANGEFALELWYGEAAEAELVVEKPKLPDAVSAAKRSEMWLQSDAI